MKKYTVVFDNKTENAFDLSCVICDQNMEMIHVSYQNPTLCLF